MQPPDQPDLRGEQSDETTIIDTALFQKLLAVASAAYVFRHQFATYFQAQAELVEQGHTIEELMAANWEAFSAFQYAEQRLFDAVDELENITTR